MEQRIYNRQVTKLSLSLRVIDEQQVERHYRNTDLAELYKFDPLVDDKPTIKFPKDRLLADVFLKYQNYVYDCFEHDSLLENKVRFLFSKGKFQFSYHYVYYFFFFLLLSYCNFVYQANTLRLF